ncbi:hypothetical protein [Butyrivibrio sp. AE3004]|uniref:hypothetical protein n=1 Tax=Butyrivibrio sp. AE3004 TaxID=1506994 RepID=UPI0018CC587E|nr:hypothetical protein [Butyrivibrio sp. AE3004]
MRIRITVILYILSFTISLFIFSAIMDDLAINFEYTSYASCATLDNNIFYAQNTRNGGVILKLDTSGKVKKIFRSLLYGEERVLAVSAYDGRLYAVLSNYSNEFDHDNTDGYVPKAYYRILCMDEDFSVVADTSKFAIDEGVIFNDLSVDKTGMIITAITTNGKSVWVYHIGNDQLREDFSKEEKPTVVEAIWTKNAKAGRFYSDALYTDNQLYVRTDADGPAGVLSVDSYIKEIVGNIKLSAGQVFTLYSGYIIRYVTFLLIWFVLLFFIIKVLFSRNRTFYFLLIAEGVLFCITLVGTMAIVRNFYDARVLEHSRFAVTSLFGLADEIGLNNDEDYTDKDIYATERYQEIKDDICEFVRRDGNTDVFYDVFLYNLSDGMVCVSSSGRNRQAFTDIFGSGLSELSEEIYRGRSYSKTDIVVEGQDYRAVAIKSGDSTPRYALMAIINVATFDKTVFIKNQGFFLLFLTIFALGSALVIFVWRLYLRDITVLEYALSSAAGGGRFPERPANVGIDVKEMWDSVTEINKKLEENEYIKIRILEAYYRFAPKNVERALFKNSILEVQNGSSSAIKGTVAVIGIDIGGYAPGKLDSVLESIGEYQKENDCMIVGKSPDLSLIEMFFMETDSSIVKFMIDLYIQNMKNRDLAVLSTVLCYDDCNFCVMGGSEEATIYLHSENQQVEKRIVEFVRNLKIGLVITEKVRDRENVESPIRFMGYSKYEQDGSPMELYEVLDAYPANLRAKRLSTLERFDDALKCYMDKDFYIARTKFSDILKETPDDNLARWYVFESEKYLNEVAEGDKYKFLHL